MQLTEEQKKEVAAWIAAGARLSEVQQRLSDEFGIRLTYMEARFLVDDLSLVPAEKEEPKKEEKSDDAAAPGAEDAVSGEGDDDQHAAGAGGVSVSVDKIVKPGAMLSGSVTFSDGVTAEWYIDTMGRFGLVPPDKGYRPKQEDLMEFRVQLERVLSRQGL